MLGIKGEEEEQPARRSARRKSVRSSGLGRESQGDLQRRMMAMAMSIIRTW